MTIAVGHGFYHAEESDPSEEVRRDQSIHGIIILDIKLHKEKFKF